MRTLLVVDDEPALLFSVTEYLTRVGYAVRAAASGAEALERLMEEAPDLIVSDILMEEMDGFELQRRVQGLTGGEVPFIFLTAKGDLRDRLAGLRGGADDYIVKPFEPEELEARIGAVFARMAATRRQVRRELHEARGQLLAEASEQLATPVTDVVVHLEKLREETGAEAAGAPQEQIEGALARATALGALVSDLSWAAADAGAGGEVPLRKEVVRIAPVVRSAAANAARLARQRGIELKIQCGGLLSGVVDAEALSRALGGLLEALVALSPPGSVVSIQARRASEGGLEITLTDGGPAAAEAEEPGASAPTAAPEGGAGRALEFARRVIQAHGGAYDARMAPDGRCSIVMWLPGRVAKHIGRKG